MYQNDKNKLLSFIIFYRLADKIQVTIEKMKNDGSNDAEIKDILQQQKTNSVEKYGNKSKIGLILETENEKMLRNQKIIENDNYLKKLKLKNASDFNRAQLQ